MASLFSKINYFFPPKATTTTSPQATTTETAPAATTSTTSTTSDHKDDTNTKSSTEASPPVTEKKGVLSTISSGASTVLQQPSQSIYKIGSLLSTFANKVVEKIEDERLKLLTEQERINITDIESAHVKPPWLDIPTSDIRVQEEVRVLILGLTRSKRNFLNAPPEDIDFPFNYDEALPVAIASLQADQRLDMARFCLVPMYLKGIVNDCNNKRTRRISSKDCCHERVSGLLYALSLHPETEKEEEMFWRNWFYRVHTIMTAYGLHLNLRGTRLNNSTGVSDIKEVEVGGGSAAYLDKDLEKELSQLGVHTAESNPEAWEEELRAELESMSEKGLTGSLADNWEEELRKELGIKDELSLSDEILKNTKETTPLTVSSPKIFKEDVAPGEVSSRSPPRNSPTKGLKDDVLDSSSDDDKPAKPETLVALPPDTNASSNNNNTDNNTDNNNDQNDNNDYNIQNYEHARSPDNNPGPDPAHDTTILHTPSYRTSTSLHVDDETNPASPQITPDTTDTTETTDTDINIPEIETTSNPITTSPDTTTSLDENDNTTSPDETATSPDAFNDNADSASPDNHAASPDNSNSPDADNADHTA